MINHTFGDRPTFADKLATFEAAFNKAYPTWPGEVKKGLHRITRNLNRKRSRLRRAFYHHKCMLQYK